MTSPKALWRISSPYTAPVTLRATDWISALGAALHQLGRASQIDRMACERLANNELIVNDLTHEKRYVVQKLAEAVDLPEVEVEVDAFDDDEITQLNEPIAAFAFEADEDPLSEDEDELLELGGAFERPDPYSGWGMSLDVEESEEHEALGLAEDDDDEDSDEDEPVIVAALSPVVSTVKVAAALAPAVEDPVLEALEDDDDSSFEDDGFEDLFAFEEEDLSNLPEDESTMVRGPDRRSKLAPALRELKSRRSSTP